MNRVHRSRKPPEERKDRAGGVQPSESHALPSVPPKPELLAPAGNVESLCSAIEHGADAVYLGLKRLSARASASNFTLEELSCIVPYAHKRHKAIYVAINSLVSAQEFGELGDLLAALDALKVDALIVQDPALFYLVPRLFPDLKLHASTLMGVHNHWGVNQLHRMGADRVVLARELTLEEMEAITRESRAEVEIFVHGALCYSYSGLCLASSFRGGHSGLQGRCVQPCRLKFKQGRKEGFFLSCSDLCALPLLPQLKKLRLAAYKLEGRMKSADAIATMVKAYRHVMDSPPDREAQAVAEAQEWLIQSPSRRLTTGFYGKARGDEILAPHRSGSSGLWVGSVLSVQDGKALIALRHDIRTGDRIRPESVQGRERDAFTLTSILSETGKPLEEGRGGSRVILRDGSNLAVDERLFRVGVKTKGASGLWQKLRRESPPARPYAPARLERERLVDDWPQPPVDPRGMAESLTLKVSSTGDLARAFQSPAQWVMLTASRSNLEKLARQKLIPAQLKRFAWSLPPLISQKETAYFKAAVQWYRTKGFHAWELNNWGHFDLFDGSGPLTWIAGYRFNLRNAGALAELAQVGCSWTILSLEITRDELQELARGPLPSIPAVTVYGWPPLFVSRIIPKLLEGRPFFTPRKDVYYFTKSGHHALIYADRPMNWFEQLPVLRAMGYRNFVVDLSEGPSGIPGDFERVLSGFRRQRADEPYSLFNFDFRLKE